MKEELLKEIREEVKGIKEKMEEHNADIKRVKELEKDPHVKEYITLMRKLDNNVKKTEYSEAEIIASIYRKYISQIEDIDTNEIYVYLGTYTSSSEIDIVHGANDIRVRYDDPSADYRIYWNIEQSFAENIFLPQCKEFEETHVILNPSGYFKREAFYKIQQEFFVKAAQVNQKAAAKSLLKKYPKLKENQQG